MTTLNARKFLRLLEATAPHSGSENQPVLHGIRLDSDGTVLHAVATDRFTLAIARAQLREATASWALTIPTPDVAWLTTWLKAQPGDTILTLSPTGDTFTVTAGKTTLTLAARKDTFIAWRDVVRTGLANPLSPSPLTALGTDLLTRWATAGQRLRVWQPAADKPLVLTAEDFLGLQMPIRTTDSPTQDTITGAWTGSLGTGNSPAELGPAWPAFDKTAEFDEQVLRQTLRATAAATDTDNRDLFHAWIHAGIYAWSAHRLLAALRTADPDLAESTIRNLNAELEDGAFSEYAWDAARDAGHNPDQWQQEYEAHKTQQAQPSTTR